MYITQDQGDIYVDISSTERKQLNADRANRLRDTTNLSKLLSIGGQGQGIYFSNGIPTLCLEHVDLETNQTIGGTKYFTANHMGFINGGETDKFFDFAYGGDPTASNAPGASWRLGALNSGSGNSNYFVIQTGGSDTTATTWKNAMRIGMNDLDVTFSGLVTSTGFKGTTLTLGESKQNGASGILKIEGYAPQFSLASYGDLNNADVPAYKFTIGRSFSGAGFNVTPMGSGDPHSLTLKEIFSIYQIGGTGYLNLHQNCLVQGGHTFQTSIVTGYDEEYAHLVKPLWDSPLDDAGVECIYSLDWQGNIEAYGAIRGDTVHGAVWNDYAEYRAQKEDIQPGYCVASSDNGEVYKTTEKFAVCDGIVSDTFGFSIGETETAKTPLAVAGRVLAYFAGNREDYHAGDVVCAGPEGKVMKMTREEIREYPDRILGHVSEIPNYETWGTGNIAVNGRIWIKVR